MRRRINQRGNFRIRDWQVSRGYQVCVSCFHESTILAVHRCTDCDREVCTHCVVTIAETREYVCPDCATERQRDAREPVESVTKRQGRRK
jgi:hypothetical protein